MDEEKKNEREKKREENGNHIFKHLLEISHYKKTWLLMLKQTRNNKKYGPRNTHTHIHTPQKGKSYGEK